MKSNESGEIKKGNTMKFISQLEILAQVIVEAR